MNYAQESHKQEVDRGEGVRALIPEGWGGRASIPEGKDWSSTLGVARCGRDAGCVLCALWAVSAAVCVGGVPCGGKHIIKE